MKIFLHICTYIITCLGCFSISGGYLNSLYAGQHSLIVKFTTQSDEYIQWKNNERKGTIQSLVSILGNHTSRPMLRSQIFDLLISKSNANSKVKKNILSVVNLESLAIIEYDADITPEIVSKKISSYSFIEYAEPKPVHTFNTAPNDPMISMQNYLNQIHAFEAWEYYESSSRKDSILISIVDTGIDTNHEDLLSALYINAGEDGLDQKGVSKRANGIDDDLNGFIDDWSGWDFASSANIVSGDNSPFPGHFHGTHVAGIAAAISENEKGIAGIARRVKILPVKVSKDDSTSLTVENSYEGLLYAAAMGARIINCSWGSPSPSIAEAEIVANAQQFGCLIVAGAGNDGKETSFYPASYPNVLSVAAVYYDATKTSYSNFSPSVDISAPGSSIFSTLKGNTYGYSSGTSMSAPIISGTAALIASVFPLADAQQIAARIISSAKNIDSINPLFARKIGFGLVDCMAALSQKNLQYIAIIQKQITDETADDMYTPGESIDISLSIKNVLETVDSAYIIASCADSNVNIVFKKDTIYAGTLQPSTVYSLPFPLSFTLPENPPYNYPLLIHLDIYSASSLIARDAVQLVINPTYRTLAENDITVTINSQGNIGYNDYPSNTQGQGLASSYYPYSVLFEGAFMAGISPNRLSNIARDASGDAQDQSWIIKDPIKVSIPGMIADLEAHITFKDEYKADQAGFTVKQKVYQSNDDSLKDILLLSYEITNNSGVNYDSVFAGLFFDWDIGPAGQNNICGFNQLKGYGYCYNDVLDKLPYTGVALLTGQSLNYCSIDNDGGGGYINIYDGFSRNEKWRAMSGGLTRAFSRPTDVSMVISGGPERLDAEETKKFVFAVFIGTNEQDLDRKMESSRSYAAANNIGSGFIWNQAPRYNQLKEILIGRDQAIYIDYQVSARTNIHFEVNDMLGKLIKRISIGEKNAGIYTSERISFDGLSSGTYIVKYITDYGYDALPFVLIR